MRISDWSSDVCSSDLGRALALTATETGIANASHGHGRRRPWAVIGDGGRSSLRMRYDFPAGEEGRSEEHTSELQSLMRISYAVFCLKNQMTAKCHQL